MKNPAGVYPKLALPLTRLDVDLVLFQPFLLDALLQPLVERVLWTDEAEDLMVLAVDTQCCGLETKFFPHINLHLVVIFLGPWTLGRPLHDNWARKRNLIDIKAARN